MLALQVGEVEQQAVGLAQRHEGVAGAGDPHAARLGDQLLELRLSRGFAIRSGVATTLPDQFRHSAMAH